MRRKLTLVVGVPLGALTAGFLIGAPSTAAPAAFTHPGVLVGTAQLDFTRSKVNCGAQPWKGTFDAMTASKYASLSRTPKPRAIVECGSYSDPDYGCTDEREDALAAYTLSLAWYITRDSKYADKAIQIMDAWSGTIKDHTNSNAPLQTGWLQQPLRRLGNPDPCGEPQPGLVRSIMLTGRPPRTRDPAADCRGRAVSSGVLSAATRPATHGPGGPLRATVSRHPQLGQRRYRI